MSPPFTIEEVSSEEEFRRLRPEWSDLTDRDPRATVFQTWEFQFGGWMLSRDRVRPVILLVRDGTGLLVGCAPFGEIRWKLGPISASILGFGCIKYCDYNDLILDDGVSHGVIEKIAGWLRDHRNRYDVIHLRQVREDAWLIDGGGYFDPDSGQVEKRETDTAPYLAIDRSWESWESLLSGRKARAMRYTLKRLTKKLGSDFRTAAQGNELTQPLDDFMDLHQSRMGEKNQSGIFAESHVRKGFGEMIRLMSERDLVEIHTMSGEGRTIAAVCTFQYRGVVSFYQGGFDPALNRLSPGKAIQTLCVDRAIRQDVKEYDFLTGDEPYKYTWANKERKLFDIEFRRRSWKGSVYRTALRWREKLSESERLRRLYLKLKGN